ncbi:MAG TPA: hypothetical protein VL728_08180 [Cyclobacteriaceae bacterium]|jgi:hypothetical protein|nr:hypothetical protein [Cyclobacteriaceae bacterium]
MKKQILISAILFGACTMFVNVQARPSNTATIETAIQEKTEVKAADLPDAVKKTLASDDYKGWEIAKAYLAKEIYEVELKKGTETKTVKLDKDGKIVM